DQATKERNPTGNGRTGSKSLRDGQPDDHTARTHGGVDVLKRTKKKRHTANRAALGGEPKLLLPLLIILRLRTWLRSGGAAGLELRLAHLLLFLIHDAEQDALLDEGPQTVSEHVQARPTCQRKPPARMISGMNHSMMRCIMSICICIC